MSNKNLIMNDFVSRDERLTLSEREEHSQLLRKWIAEEVSYYHFNMSCLGYSSESRKGDIYVTPR